MDRMVVLGWGSLIWEARPDFDCYLSGWVVGGPRLPIEFARKSETRRGALTLVIDRSLGTSTETLYAFSKRTDPRDVICDLRTREGTTAKNIGFVNLEDADEHGRDEEIRNAIKTWAKANNILFVAWTDLKGHFVGLTPDRFVASALEYLKSLDTAALREVVKYVTMAPVQTDTRLHRTLMSDPWFKEQIARHEGDA